MKTIRSPQESPLPITSETTVAENGKELIGYHLCEFCESKGIPNDNPSSVCECTKISRGISGLNPSEYKEMSDIKNIKDTALRAAETALIEHWAAYWDDSVTITSSTLGGMCGDEHTITISFDGVLTTNSTNHMSLIMQLLVFDRSKGMGK